MKDNNVISNKIIKYDSLFYNSSPVKYSDFVIDKYNNVHSQLYNHALNELLKSLCEENNTTIEDFSKTHVFVEIKQKEYWLPSKVIIKEVVHPYKIEKYDLTEYWNTYLIGDEYRDMDKVLFDEDTLKDCEIIYIDYVSGKAKFRSKFTGKEFWKDFKYINEKTRINKDSTTLKNTFTYKLQNKIYGE